MARIYGGRIVVTATATKLSELLVTVEPTVDDVISELKGMNVLCRAETTNAAVVYFGWNNTVTAAGVHATAFIAKGEAIQFSLNTWLSLDSIWVIGSANDLVYVNVIDQ